jgi:hypothetical protein
MFFDFDLCSNFDSGVLVVTKNIISEAEARELFTMLRFFRLLHCISLKSSFEDFIMDVLPFCE